MKKLVLLLSIISLLSCQPQENGPSDTAARASGRFAVQSYVVYGDTLYKSGGVNTIGVSEFYIIVDRKTPDSVRIGSFYKKIGEPGTIGLIKDVGVSETNGTFQLSSRATASSGYEGSIAGNTFYERSVGGGLIVLPPAYSLKDPNDPTLEGVIISAKK